jgi:DNA-binding CsgD family transcriptional regulator
VDEPPLVGRAAELGRSAGWVDEVATGVGRAVLVAGEPGIGKSALLRAVGSAAASAQCAVYRGSGEELGQAFPLRPLLDAFGIRRSPPDPLRQEVLRALRAQHDGAPAAAAQALLDLVDELCARSPAVLLIDDLHWADPTTVAVCHRLARTAAQRPLLLVGAMRPLPRREDLRALRAEVGRNRVLDLGPLPPEAVGELVAGLAAGRPGPRLLQVAGDAAGNPLYVTELVAALDRGERLARTHGTVEVTAGATPTTLTEAIGDRLRFLSEPTQQVLRAAALLGGEFTGADLAAVTGGRPADLAPLLAEARDAGVLADAGGRMAFRHPLIRAALYDDLPSTIRAAWHRDAARALHRAGAGPERVAGQLLPSVTEDAAGPFDNWVADWLLDVAPALTGEAPAVALPLLRAVVAQRPADDPRRQMLTNYLARALSDQNEAAAVEALATQTLPHVTDPDLVVALFDGLARTRGSSPELLADTLAAIEHALATLPWLTATARNQLRVISARGHYICNDLDGAERAARTALTEALASGDAWSLTWSANAIAVVLAERGDPTAALELVDRHLAASDGLPALIDTRLLMLINRGDWLMKLDRFDEARASMTAARTLAERTGKVRRLAQSHSALCEVCYESGRWDDALAEAELATGIEDPLEECATHSITAMIEMHRQRKGPGRQHLAAARRYAEELGYPYYLWVRAAALDREFDDDPAAALAVYMTALGGPTRTAEAETWLADVVRLAVGQGDRVSAADAARRATEVIATGATPGRLAAAAYCQGLLDQDPDLLLQAADGYATAGRPLLRAQALEAAAALLAERGGVAAARAPFVAAMGLDTELGAAWDLHRSRARFRPYGLRQPTRRLTRPTTGWEALTTAETRVAELVAKGLSNPEIAKELVVARPTVETHVARVLAKLEVRSRIDIARAAATRAQAAR